MPGMNRSFSNLTLFSRAASVLSLEYPISGRYAHAFETRYATGSWDHAVLQPDGNHGLPAGFSPGGSHSGLLAILRSPAQLTTDAFLVSGLGGAFLNAGLVGLCCTGVMALSRASCPACR